MMHPLSWTLAILEPYDGFDSDTDRAEAAQ